MGYYVLGILYIAESLSDCISVSQVFLSVFWCWLDDRKDIKACASYLQSSLLKLTSFIHSLTHSFFMAAMCNRAGHYCTVVPIFLSIFFPLPNLSGRRLDVYHTSTHGVALVQI